MDRAPSSLASLDALELRVLEGPQRGARAPLQTGLGCVLAADAATPSIAADILLREAQAPPTAIRVTAQLEHALVEVLHGEVTLGGQLLSAGAQAAWPRHAPLQVGSSRVAYGLACEDDWPLPGAADAGEGAVGEGAPPPTPLRRRPEVWLLGVGACVLLLCAAAFGITHGAGQAPPPVVAPDASTIVQQLEASEFAALAAHRLPDGRIGIGGRLSTLAQRARLDDWLAARQARAAVDVAVDEAVAREVTEVFRVNGVAAQVHLAGPGRFVAEAAERDAQRLARAEEVVRRDVRGLQSLVLHNSAPPVAPPVVPVVTDPGKRIASIVPGDPAYVVTVDGARYFTGALLPSGHRILHVAQQQLTLERDGQQSTLNF